MAKDLGKRDDADVSARIASDLAKVIGELGPIQHSDLMHALRSVMDLQNRNALYRAFARFRRAKGISQTELAKRMNTSQSAVSDIEKGLNDARLSTLQRMARALDGELTFSLSTRWPSYHSWIHRSVEYESMPRLKIEHEDRLHWNEVLQAVETSPSTFSYLPLAIEEVDSARVEDNYLTRQDLVELNAGYISVDYAESLKDV